MIQPATILEPAELGAHLAGGGDEGFELGVGEGAREGSHAAVGAGVEALRRDVGGACVTRSSVVA